MDYEKPILITGIARSGTSLTAGIINICGAFAGETYKGNINNPKGMFENIKIINNIVKPFLRNSGFDSKCQYPLPEKLKIPNDWRNQIMEILRNEGYQNGNFLVKDAKMIMMWEIWHNAFPDAKWIIVRRNSDGIVNSCLRTGFMKAFDNKKDWKWWVDKHLNKIEEMKQHVNYYEVWSNEIVNDYTKAKDMIDWLGLEYKENEIDEFIDKKLLKS